ncbi:discoidin domain-containing protein [Pedobacter nutrimenti]|uniref:discoidin domain-containing protein n=1 Tax=Pedobacter nutrimenti TaxID=1241337 RepID=UPI00292D5F32|nr:discoidin domain-containing protein [Pedobacter nutrimenti]
MKTNRLMLLALLLGFFTLPSCKNTAELSKITPENKKPNGTADVTPSIVTHSRNLAVVYFIPSDLDTVANWKTRLSDVMLYAQNWYGNAMQAAGYGNKTFGLTPDGSSQKVQIILIRGNSPKATYGQSSGAYTTEVDAYFSAHPGLKTSNHVLILLPAFGYDNNTTEGPQPLEGVQPFNGYGRYCLAMDNVYMNMALKGVMNPGRNNFAKWIGGMMHEIGHAFNAPHDKQMVSQNIWPGANFKEPIMALSNFYLEVRPCFITDAEAAIFNTCEVFNNDSKTYYGSVTATVNKIYANYDAAQSAIVVSGKYSSTGTVSKILYYNDPNVNNEGTGTNKDYNAITWASSPIGTDSFKVVMPINELQYKTDGIPYELKIKLVHDNGVIAETIYSYTFNGGLPVLNFSTRNELSKTGWTIAGFSSQESASEGLATSTIDGSAATFWHSRWSSNAAVYPHYITVDLGSVKTAQGLSYTHRSGAYRAVKDFEILISNDGTNFTSLGNKVTAMSSGPQYFDFSTPQTFRYFKILCKSSWDGTQNAAIAELGLY